MCMLAQLFAVALLAGIGTAGGGPPAAAPVTAEPHERPTQSLGTAEPATRVLAGYFLETTTIEFVDGTKAQAVVVLPVRDDGNLNLTNPNGQAWCLAYNA